jgi:hypothetical protein
MATLFNIKIDNNEIDNLYLNMAIFERLYDQLREKERNKPPIDMFDMIQLHTSSQETVKLSNEDKKRMNDLKLKIENAKKVIDEFKTHSSELKPYMIEINKFYTKYQYRGISWSFMLSWQQYSKRFPEYLLNKSKIDYHYSIDELSLLNDMISSSLNDLDKYYSYSGIQMKPASRICSNQQNNQINLLDL